MQSAGQVLLLAPALKSIAKIAWRKALVLASQLQRVGSFGAKETRPAAAQNHISYILIVGRDLRDLPDLTSSVYGYIS